MSTCLITGGAGNLACQLSWTLSQQFERIVLLDVAPAPIGSVAPNAEFERGDLLDSKQLDGVFDRLQPATVIHLASLLSGNCEQNRVRGWQVNMDGTFALFETALRHKRPTVLFASTIAAFGGQLPEVLTDDTPQWPDGLYGVTKMAAERLGVYYHRCHGLDFRCLRLPITVSRHAPPGAASALASLAFIEAARNAQFTFRSRPDSKLALIYIRDVLCGFADLLATPASHLTQRVYNIGAMTVTPREIANAILRRLPEAVLRFEPEETVAALLASWPGVIDDSAARRDWNWHFEFDLERTADDFLSQLRQEFTPKTA
ncbi:MAG: NAD-dependent epimerase/dehydratase family protein [Verrucomicrobia bacterium]|nr:NAD-dependent epimerase/dehydratase family protein [Verrucomicrobiota bacterium]